MANLISMFTKSGNKPVARPTQSTGLGNLNVNNLMKPTDDILTPAGIQQVSTINVPVIKQAKLATKKDVADSRQALEVIREGAKNMGEVLENAAQMHKEAAKLGVKHGSYLMSARQSELQLQQANVTQGIHSAQLAPQYNNLGLRLQGAVNEAVQKIDHDTQKYQLVGGW